MGLKGWDRGWRGGEAWLCPRWSDEGRTGGNIKPTSSYVTYLIYVAAYGYFQVNTAVRAHEDATNVTR